MSILMRFFGLVSLLILCTDCVKNNARPVWLKINKFKLIANPNHQFEESSLTHAFDYAQIDIDGKVAGIFKLPITLPLLINEGSHQVRISPVVKLNGINDTKVIYPFVKAFSESYSLSKSDTAAVNPITTYESNTRFWKEDFEGAILLNQPEPNGNNVNNMTPVNHATITPEYGTRYGKVLLNSTLNDWVASTSPITLPQGGANVYFEMDYYNLNTIEMSIIALSSINGIKVNPYLTVAAQLGTPKWKKIYIGLSEVVSSSLNAEQFSVGFSGKLNDGLTDSYIYLDNLNIVYF